MTRNEKESIGAGKDSSESCKFIHRKRKTVDKPIFRFGFDLELFVICEAMVLKNPAPTPDARSYIQVHS